MKLKLSLVLLCLIVFGFCVLRFYVLPDYDKAHNAIAEATYKDSGNKAISFHQSAFVVDLHADSLLWGRDLRQLQNRGHIDLPRLIKGGVDLQVFSVVSKVPNSLNYLSNRADSDVLPALFVASWRSPSTWFSPKQRALVQASELVELSKVSVLSLILNKQDLMNLKRPAGLLALEGMHALGSDTESLDEFYVAGFRMMGLAHFFDNDVAGSAHGVKKHGLTELGRQLIPRMESLGITIDLAHASLAAFNDSIKLAKRPLVVSHTGVQGTCPGPRNLSDDQLRAIAANGGVVGIGYWQAAVCGVSARAITRAILYAIRVAGIDHVALGSDFDGHVTTPFDITGLPLITESLLKSGLSEPEVSKILGGNVFRVLMDNLPE